MQNIQPTYIQSEVGFAFSFVEQASSGSSGAAGGLPSWGPCQPEEGLVWVSAGAH